MRSDAGWRRGTEFEPGGSSDQPDHRVACISNDQSSGGRDRNSCGAAKACVAASSIRESRRAAGHYACRSVAVDFDDPAALVGDEKVALCGRDADRVKRSVERLECAELA